MTWIQVLHHVGVNVESCSGREFASFFWTMMLEVMHDVAQTSNGVVVTIGLF